LDVGDSEDGAFWTAFLRSLKARGLAGVQLIVSEAHTGLKQAIGAVLGGAAWRRCRVHFHRDWIYDHDQLAPERTTEDAFDRLNPEFGVPADRSNRIGHRDVQQRER
jgi:Transposase, Mutator family